MTSAQGGSHVHVNFIKVRGVMTPHFFFATTPAPAHFKTEGESTIWQRAWLRPEGGWWAFVRRLACVAV